MSAAAFPSACGKTNLAMLIPPEGYPQEGLQGLDLWATISPGCAGRRRPPVGHQPGERLLRRGPGTNMKSNPNALASTQKGTIFTNVAHNLDDNTVWWEGLDKNPPENALNWKGEPWNGKTSEEKGAHPNSRFTAPAKNCPCISAEFDQAAAACRFPPSSSAAAALRPRLWCISPVTGTTACS